MLKRILFTLSILMFGFTSPCFAGSFYLGPGLSIQDIITKTSGFRGAAARIIFGYGEIMEGYYFAGELFGIPSTATLQTAGSPNPRTGQAIGASFLPGFLVGTQTIAFARLGIVTTKFKSLNVYKTGGQIGIGLQTCVSPSWDLRGEYIYSVYHSVRNVGVPRSDEYVLSFLYRFDSYEV